MLLGIDSRELSSHPAGKGQYLTRLLQSWFLEKDLPIILYFKKGQDLPLSLLEQASSKVRMVSVSGRGPLWHRRVAKRLKRDGVSVFLAALSYQSAIWNSIPTVTIVHDLAIFKLPGLAHNRRAKIVERLTLGSTIKRSKSLIAVSQNTKKDLEEIYRLPENKVKVIYEAAFFDQQPVLPWGKRKKYILFVGTLEPRKNITTLLKAYARLPAEIRQQYPLRLAGKPGWGGEDYPELASRLEIEDQVEFLGYVSNEELQKLYREASVFVYPSLYEGFGLPVIEAMSAGTPVVTSNCSSLPEVVGDEVVTYNPTDDDGISQGIIKIVSDQYFWEKQSRQLLERSKKFDWPEISQAVLEVLQQASG